MDERSLFSNIGGLSTKDQSVISQVGRGPPLTVPYGTVHGAFEHMVDTYPSSIAAVHGDQKITYRQLDLKANRLANYLIAYGLLPKDRVCVVVQRSLEMLIGLFAILKAGCQYVPIDGGVVSEKALQHIFEDTQAKFVLCLPRYWDRARQFARRDAVIIALDMNTGAFYSHQRPEISVGPEDGVYAMYTSGSTGTPKGVDIKHGSKTNALLSEPARLGITVGSKVAQVLSISFAMGAWEMLGCLLNGGTLYLRGSDWLATLETVDTLICTPSILIKYQQHLFPNIKTVAVAGEPCSQALADAWAPGRSFYNFIGATEVFHVAAHRHVVGEPLSIGRPLPNVTCYILDDAKEPVAFGEKGTLWVGGAGVSRGYINLPLTTAERYLPDRFANNGALMYNFGNIVSWRADGALQSFGREDDQVKIRGFRVELDGVTTVLESFTGITRAASLIINDVLHGFYASNSPFQEHELDAFVRKQLPYYSVPEKWMRLDVIPLNPNGKIDKAQLRVEAAILGQTMACKESTEPIREQQSPNHEVVTIPEKIAPVPVLAEELPQLQERAIRNVDLEQQVVIYPSTGSDSTMSTEPSKSFNVSLKLPLAKGLPAQSWLRHRALIAYRCFLLAIVAVNIAVACWILDRKIKHHDNPLPTVATATAANLTAAILVRSEPVINLLFFIFSSVPTWFPLSIRRVCAQVYHIGGIHSGCAIAAVIWFIIFTVLASIDLGKTADQRTISEAPTTLAYIIVTLLLSITAQSHPWFRVRYHDIWEKTHRFGGWTILILYWVLVGLCTRDFNHGSAGFSTCLRNPSFWLIVVSTIAIVFPWLFLRRVPVRAEVLSTHAVRLHFKHAQLKPGHGIRLAASPLGDWHGFATFTNAYDENDKSFSAIVSRAGDFTGHVIDTAPDFIWKRGIPTYGVFRIATLFKSVVVVATGSGIGPCLSIFPFHNIAMRILWSAPNHKARYGTEILDIVRKKDPNVVMYTYNRQTHGKSHMSLMAYQLYEESGAEAVLVISNKKLTTEIVFDMESRGIPAYGAIFDS